MATRKGTKKRHTHQTLNKKPNPRIFCLRAAAASTLRQLQPPPVFMYFQPLPLSATVSPKSSLSTSSDQLASPLLHSTFPLFSSCDRASPLPSLFSLLFWAVNSRHTPHFSAPNPSPQATVFLSFTQPSSVIFGCGFQPLFSSQLSQPPIATADPLSSFSPLLGPSFSCQAKQRRRVQTPNQKRFRA